MAETLMSTPAGERVVRRPYTGEDSPLRAWSSADEMVLTELGTDELGRTLIVNDEFGALSVGLAHAEPVVWVDSVLSQLAIDDNLTANGLAVLGDRLVVGSAQPEGQFDTVVVRVPKTSALLDYQLAVIGHLVSPQTRVVGAAMARHIHRSTLESFEAAIGAATSTRAVKKARLIHSTPSDKERPPVALTFGEFRLDDGTVVSQLPGIFSAGHLDVGSALLLQVMREVSPPSDDATVLDLGCGAGVLAAAMANHWEHARFVLVDVSDLAVAAAAETWRRNGFDPERAQIVAADGVAHLEADSVDIVVTNPPFHQGHARDADLTDRLLVGAARVLSSGGAAYIVVQRHLNLHQRAKQWFSDVQVASQHPTHVVLHCTTR